MKKVITSAVLVSLLSAGLVLSNRGLEVRNVLNTYSNEAQGRLVTRRANEVATNNLSNVKAQISSVLENGKRHIRFVAALDSYLYDEVNFTITASDGTTTKTLVDNEAVNRAYTYIEAGEEVLSASEAFGEGYNYFVAYTINNVPESAWGYTFSALVSAKAEGYSEAVTKSADRVINDMIENESEGEFEIDVWDGTVASSITNGSGTETDPYIVNTGAELAFVSSKVKAEDSNYKQAYYKLGNNIDLNDIEWTPIGSSNSNPFQGSFDGNGKVIIGMKISKGAAVGLFGHIADAYISNIDLTANVTPTAVNGGILVGRAQPSTISNCIVRGTLTSNSQYVGGIVPTVNAYDASVNGTQTKMVIKNCTNYATITTTTTQTNNFIGGIVAQSVETVALELDGCVNRGNVTGTNSYVAGIISIVRKNESSIVKNCYNYGDISSGSKSRMTGGIAGASRGRFENCYGYELAKVNNIAGNNATAQLYPETNGTTVPGAIICGQWDAVANCTSNSGFFNCGMCDVDGNPVAK